MATADRNNYYSRLAKRRCHRCLFKLRRAFADTSRGHAIVEGPIRTGYPPSTNQLWAIKECTGNILVTAIPYPSFSDQTARETATKLGAPFIPVPSDDLLFWDYHHLNRVGRARVTSILLSSSVIDRRNR
jgi:hypothetical protein